MLKDLMDLVAPRRCFECGGGVEMWCEVCRAGLRSFSARLTNGTALHSVSHQDESMMRAIAAWKDQGHRGLTPIFARELLKLAGQLPEAQKFQLVVIPSRRQSLRSRGYQPTAELARQLARVQPERFLYRLDVLCWSRQPREQRGLADGERALNLAGALSVESLPERPVVLLDDVYTSGSTVAEASRALTAAGAHLAAIVVLALPRKVVGQELVKSVAKPQPRV
jgi:predicted amidophosphoribosyltransferase